MPSSLLRGLRVLERVAEGPVRQAELATLVSVDHSAMSRVLSALERDGWVVRLGGLYRLGPRSVALGTSPDREAFARTAEETARLLSGLSTLACSVTQLVDGEVAVVATSMPERLAPVVAAEVPTIRPWLTAAGVALLAQVDAEALPAYLDESDWPRPTAATPDAAAVRRALAATRDGALAGEDGWSLAGVSCRALPWPGAAPWARTALALIGWTDDVTAQEPVVEALLRAAVAPDVDRVTIARAATRSLTCVPRPRDRAPLAGPSGAVKPRTSVCLGTDRRAV